MLFSFKWWYNIINIFRVVPQKMPKGLGAVIFISVNVP